MDEKNDFSNNQIFAKQQPANPAVKLSVIIPVYNEQETITEIVERVVSVILPGIEKEIIIVNDGSSDNSAEIIQQVAQKYPHTIKTYTSIINLGKGSSIRICIVLSTGDIILIQDADWN